MDLENHLNSRTSSINRNNFGNIGNHQGNIHQGSSMNQNGLQQSSCGTYLSGPSAHSGGENSGIHLNQQNNNHPSQFLSPSMKIDNFHQLQNSSARQQTSFNLGNELITSYNSNILSSENRANKLQSSNYRESHYRSSSLPKHHDY